MVAATAMAATCLSSLLLGSFMCGLVVVCRNLGLDPGAPLSPHLSPVLTDPLR